MSTVIVNDLSLYISRGIAPKYTENEEDSIVVINQKCIRDYKIDLRQSRRNCLKLRKVPIDKILNKYDILINSTGVGTLGRVGQFYGESGSATVDSHVTIIRPDLEAIDPIYFGYLLKYNQKNIESFAEGTTGQTELARNAIKGLKLKIVKDRNLQKLISQTLKSFDDKIENNQQINQTLEAMAQTLFKSWFVDFEPTRAKMTVLGAGGSEEDANLAAITTISGKFAKELATFKVNKPEAYAELYITASLFPSCLAESELGNIPEGWKVKSISGFGKVICGKTPSKKEPQYFGSHYPFIKIPDMHKNLFVLNSGESLSKKGSESQKKKLIPANSVCVSYGDPLCQDQFYPRR